MNLISYLRKKEKHIKKKNPIKIKVYIYRIRPQRYMGQHKRKTRMAITTLQVIFQS